MPEIVEVSLNARQAALFRMLETQITSLKAQASIFAAAVFKDHDSVTNITLVEKPDGAKLVGTVEATSN